MFTKFNNSFNENYKILHLQSKDLKTNHLESSEIIKWEHTKNNQEDLALAIRITMININICLIMTRVLPKLTLILLNVDFCIDGKKMEKRTFYFN